MKRSSKSVWIFYQDGIQNTYAPILYGPRLRLVYPDGKVEWSTAERGLPFYKTYIDDFCFNEPPCWYPNDGQPKSREEAMRLMRLYDREMGFKRMIFVGEIK